MHNKYENYDLQKCIKISARCVIYLCTGACELRPRDVRGNAEYFG